jgi:hypothetical protein
MRPSRSASGELSNSDLGPAADHPAEQQGAHPMGRIAQRAAGVDPVDLAGAEVVPYRGEPFDRAQPVVAVGGDRRGVDGAGRGAADHRKRIAPGRPAPRLEDARDAFENAHLIRGSGASTHQDQSGRGHPSGW